jgi:hypothetical protein
MSGPNVYPRSVLGRNYREVNKKQQNFDYRGTSPAPSNRLGGWHQRHNGTQRSYDDRINLDATIPGLHDK